MRAVSRREARRFGRTAIGKSLGARPIQLFGGSPLGVADSMEFESILVSKALPDGTFSQKAVIDASSNYYF
jgi:hypothetical protein